MAYVVGHADIDIMVCEDQEQTDKVLEALPELPRLKNHRHGDQGLRSFARGAQFIATFDEVEQLGAGIHSQQAPSSTTCWRASGWTTSG